MKYVAHSREEVVKTLRACAQEFRLKFHGAVRLRSTLVAYQEKAKAMDFAANLLEATVIGEEE